MLQKTCQTDRLSGQKFLTRTAIFCLFIFFKDNLVVLYQTDLLFCNLFRIFVALHIFLHIFNIFGTGLFCRYLFLKLSLSVFFCLIFHLQRMLFESKQYHQHTDYHTDRNHRDSILNLYPSCSCVFSSRSTFPFFHSTLPYFYLSPGLYVFLNRIYAFLQVKKL